MNTHFVSERLWIVFISNVREGVFSGESIRMGKTSGAFFDLILPFLSFLQEWAWLISQWNIHHCIRTVILSVYLYLKAVRLISFVFLTCLLSIWPSEDLQKWKDDNKSKLYLFSPFQKCSSMVNKNMKPISTAIPRQNQANWNADNTNISSC